MKSRTSFFNGVIFRKNLTRFAPLWLLYTLCLLLGMFLLLDRNLKYWFAANLASMCSGMGLVNFGYALLAAQVLFGDLWNTRMCNALHAMPLRRECWFATHVVSGLFFSLVPTAIMAAASELFLVGNPTMANGWQIPLYFLLASNLEYLFFFGLAVFAVFCSGNRIGMAVIYIIVNFFSYLAYFLVDTLVTPMYYGAVTPSAFYELLCPVSHISSSQLILCERQKIPGTGEYALRGSFRLAEGWGYVIILALVGIVLLLAALQLYRRRKLECAGDFLSTKKLEPVFMVIFSLTVGGVFQFVPEVFLGSRQDIPVFLFVGLAVGWFGGRMLMERQTKVFGNVKNWLGMLAMAVSVVAVLYVATLDPFGVEDWVPDAADVRKVTMQGNYRGVLETEQPEEIADIIAIHRGILGEKLTEAQANAGPEAAYNQASKMPEVLSGKWSASDMGEKIGYRQYANIRITYELKNGWTTSREYYMWADTETAALANRYFSRLDAIFYHSDNIRSADDLLALVRAPEYMYVDNRLLPERFLTAENVSGLFEAIIADCEAGTMTQSDGFHEGAVVNTDDRFLKGYHIEVNLVEEGFYFEVFADSENCIVWLEETGILDFIAADDRPW